MNIAWLHGAALRLPQQRWRCRAHTIMGWYGRHQLRVSQRRARWQSCVPVSGGEQVAGRRSRECDRSRPGMRKRKLSPFAGREQEASMDGLFGSRASCCARNFPATEFFGRRLRRRRQLQAGSDRQKVAETRSSKYEVIEQSRSSGREQFPASVNAGYRAPLQLVHLKNRCWRSPGSWTSTSRRWGPRSHHPGRRKP